MSDELDFQRNPSSDPGGTVRLRRVPLPLSGNRRRQWQIISVLVALGVCRGLSATLEQLHTLVWALRDDESGVALGRAWKTRGEGLRGYVPDLLPTLRVMQAERLIEQQSSGRQHLAERGSEVLTAFRAAGGHLGPTESLLLELAPIASAAMWRTLDEGTAV